MSVTLYPVPPDALDAVWPKISVDVENIAARSRGRMLGSDIRDMIASQERILWVAVGTAGEYLGLAMTEICQYPRRKACRLVACTGRERARWMPLLAEIERWAKSIGCDVMEGHTRKGWARELADYKMTHVFLERDI